MKKLFVLLLTLSHYSYAAATKPYQLWEFAELVLRRSIFAAKESTVRISGLMYYLLHAHPDQSYGYDLQAAIAQQSHLIKLTPQAELAITREYREKSSWPVALMRHAWALEKTDKLQDAFKEMRHAAYILPCGSKAHSETRRLAKKAYGDNECGQADICCCYTKLPCLCTCCCD